jgi:hypothetical protein
LSSDNAVDLFDYSGTYLWRLKTTQVFRDPSAWQHVVLSFDSTQGTSSNRVKFYINGAQVQTFSTATYPSSSFDSYVNGTHAHGLGSFGAGVSNFFNGYLADIHFIDGQALDPTSFGEFDATTGVWVPKAFTGSYGTNGFKLDFADNSSNTATTLGKDTSPNGNNWTPNNLSVTAGAGNDSVIDVPTNGAQTDTGAGGEVRGNYCTWNPLGGFTRPTLSNGNLDYSNSGTLRSEDLLGTFAFPSSGKWYFEFTPTTFNPSAGSCRVGIARNGNVDNANTIVYNAVGDFETFSVSDAAPNSYTQGDVIGVAVDIDATTIYFYKNNALEGSKTFSASDQFFPFTRVFQNEGGGSTTRVTNFGQRPFAYTAPSGFKALNTANLPAPLVTKPSEYMDVVTRAGGGTTQTFTALRPGLVWEKRRDTTSSHYLFDVNRGNDKYLSSDTTSAEGSLAGAFTFNTNSYTVSSGFDWPSGASVVDWIWDAGSSTVTNTQGSISSQVRANASAGFSIVTYTGTGTANSTFGHGLGVAPSLIITKNRGSASDWYVYHASLGVGSFLELNTTNAAGTLSNYWSPVNSTVFGQTYTSAGPNNGSQVAYCFAPVAGYSSFGSYVGNGSSDGSFVYTGFRPRYVLVKSSSIGGAGYNWCINDAARSASNVSNEVLYPNTSGAEETIPIDILSNGFKVRTNGATTNGSGNTYIYAAFAESPFQYARAR